MFTQIFGWLSGLDLAGVPGFFWLTLVGFTVAFMPQYLLGLMYLNGVGLAADPPRGRTLLQSAAEHGRAGKELERPLCGD